MRWQVKWLKNALFGLLPFSGALRQFKRRFRPYPTDIPEWTLEEGLRMLEMLREAGCSIEGQRVLEIGSGWRPVIPLLFSIAGARQVTLVDSQRLMDAGTFQGTVRNLANFAPQISRRLGVDENVIRARLVADSENMPGLLDSFGMDYHAPCNVITHPFPAGQWDLVISRAVLEHVPPVVLEQMLARAYHLLVPGGWTCHAVDNSDHWSHGDSHISRVNFLRYSDRFFGFLNRFNPLDYQNRLRHPEYVELLRRTGFEMMLARSHPESKAIEELKCLPLAERFRRFSREDLARLDSYFVARRQNS